MSVLLGPKGAGSNQLDSASHCESRGLTPTPGGMFGVFGFAAFSLLFASARHFPQPDNKILFGNAGPRNSLFPLD